MQPFRLSADQIAILVLVTVGLLWSFNAQAEMYVAGQIGYTSPNSLTDVRGTGALSGVTSSDLQLKNSIVGGAKIGYFFPGANWLGVETEVYGTTPHVKQQPVTFSAGGVSLPAVTAPGFHLGVITWGLNAMVRYPGKQFQPYAGVGLGVFFARAEFQGQSDHDTVPGLNALAGMRYFATEHVALFAEYKYNRATFEFPNAIGLKADYSANHIVGGLSFHF